MTTKLFGSKNNQILSSPFIDVIFEKFLKLLGCGEYFVAEPDRAATIGDAYAAEQVRGQTHAVKAADVSNHSLHAGGVDSLKSDHYGDTTLLPIHAHLLYGCVLNILKLNYLIFEFKTFEIPCVSSTKLFRHL